MKDPFRFLLTRNIWDYLRSAYRNLPFRFWQTGSLPCFSYVRNSEKELKLLESDSLWLARFDRKFLGYSHIWSTPLVINAILGHYARFWIFWRESFEARKPRLEARKIACPNKYIRFFFLKCFTKSSIIRSLPTYLYCFWFRNVIPVKMIVTPLTDYGINRATPIWPI